MANSNEYMRRYMAKRRQDRRDKVVHLAGGVCEKCGSTDALEFDHIDPSAKSFELDKSGLDRAWSAILNELAKCQLLCKSCHKEKTRAEDGWNRNAVRGEQVGTSKLTADVVRDIRRRVEAGETQTAVARSLGLHRRTIGFVVQRVSWAHVE